MRIPGSRSAATTWSLLLLLVCALCTACSESEQAPEDPVVARVDGEPIRLSEVERRAAWRLYRARLDLHGLVERETERLIEERLLESAAAPRGVEPEALLREAEAAAPPVREQDVDRYLAAHPGDVPDETARPRVRHYLEEKGRLERRLALLASLRASAEVELRLEPPPRPRSDLDLRGAPARGPEDAPVTIVQFADLRRADSARAARDLAALERALPGRLRVVHRSRPREADELGLRTAQLAAAAQRRGLFWRLHDRLAERGGVATAHELEAVAAELDLAEPLAALAEDREALLRVKQDLEQARQAGVRRAPTLFVNGRYFMALEGPSALRALVDEELERAGTADSEAR